MIHKSSLIKGLIVLVFILISVHSTAQQDPQYTHYMYNTLSVNPAYAGSRETNLNYQYRVINLVSELLNNFVQISG